MKLTARIAQYMTLFALLAGILALLPKTTQAQTQALVPAVDCFDEVAIYIGSVDLDFVRDPETEDQIAYTFAGETIRISGESQVQLGLNDGTTSIGFGDGMREMAVRESQRAATVHVLGEQQSETARNTVAYTNSSGLQVTHAATSRQLTTQMTASARQTVTTIPLTISGSQAAALNEASGALVLTEKGSAGVIMYAPTASYSVSGRTVTVDARYVVDEAGVSIEIGRYNSNYPLTIEVNTAFSDNFDNYRAVQNGETIFVAGAAADGFYVAQIDADNKTRQPHTMSIFQDQALTLHDVTVNADGAILVVAEDARGKTVLAEVASDGSKLTALNNLDLDFSAEAIAVDNINDTIVVSGPAPNAKPVNPSDIDFVAQFPVGEVVQPYAIAELDQRLRVQTQFIFDAPVLDGPLSLWPCWPYVIVGTGGTDFNCGAPNDIYAIDNQGPFGGFSDVANGSYPDYAMRWKEDRQGITYFPAAADALLDPIRNEVTSGSSGVLNSTQDATGVYASSVGGTWQSLKANRHNEVAVGAAMYHFLWNSPVATNSLDGPMVITEVHFDVDAAGADHVFELCDSVGWPQAPASSAPIDVVDDDCALLALEDASAEAALCSVETTSWDANGLLYEGITVDATNFEVLFEFSPHFIANGNSDYTGDPPVEEAHVVNFVDEFATRMDTYLTQPVTLQRQTFESGKLVTQEFMPAQVSVSSANK